MYESRNEGTFLVLVKIVPQNLVDAAVISLAFDVSWEVCKQPPALSKPRRPTLPAWNKVQILGPQRSSADVGASQGHLNTKMWRRMTVPFSPDQPQSISMRSKMEHLPETLRRHKDISRSRAEAAYEFPDRWVKCYEQTLPATVLVAWTRHKRASPV